MEYVSGGLIPWRNQQIFIARTYSAAELFRQLAELSLVGRKIWRTVRELIADPIGFGDPLESARVRRNKRSDRIRGGQSPPVLLP